MHTPIAITPTDLQAQLVALVRAFGLHRPEQTPCGQPLAVAEAHALMDLARYAPLTQQELAMRLQLEKSTVSRLVGILETRGWVARSRSPNDARAVALRLTTAGQQMADDIAAARAARFARLLAALPEDQHATVFHSLQLLVEAMHDQP